MMPEKVKNNLPNISLSRKKVRTDYPARTFIILYHFYVFFNEPSKQYLQISYSLVFAPNLFSHFFRSYIRASARSNASWNFVSFSLS